VPVEGTSFLSKRFLFILKNWYFDLKCLSFEHDQSQNAMLLRSIFLLLSTLFALNFISAQTCLPNGIIFSSQQQIDDFAANFPDCTHIEGDVLIQETVNGNITNLFGLLQRPIARSMDLYCNKDQMLLLLLG